MDRPTVSEALTHLRDFLEANDLDAALALIESLRPPDQADVFTELPTSQQQELLPQIETSDAADILEKMEDMEAAELARGLDVDTLVPILDEMEPDEVADLLGDLLPEYASAALSQMSDADEVVPLLLHPDETAGGLMTSEFLALRPRMTAAQAIEAVRSWAPEAEAAYYLFVVDRETRLVGVVGLRQLVVADPVSLIGNIMDRDVISVQAHTDQEECAQLMSRYDLLALPVVDSENHLLGAITVDDLVDVLQAEATEDIQRFGGAEPLPLLIGTGGNAGSQTTSTIIRALATGEIDFGDALHILWHEILIGLILGGMMAAIAFIRALTWGTDTLLATSVAVSIYAIVLWANGLGSLLPLAAARLGVDPTIVSGPAMSTLVDATGLLIYFSIAKMIMQI
jgi:magnesium transporter